ncbi:Aldo/keto reductase [Xylaria palmicola]|nr:Aldo/keto reductase [Xylaria palmicola]
MTETLPPSLKESLATTKVEYRRLGQSSLRVSVPILGCMSIGDSKAQDWAVNEEEALSLLKHAYDSGLNTWDTANALRKFAIPRHKVVILTKCFWAVGEAPDVHHWDAPDQIAGARDYVNQCGLSRAAIFHAVEASLARLGTAYVDLLQVHRFDRDTPVEETMRALHDLVRMGKVRYLGASSMWAVQFAQMQFVAEKNGWTKFISMQNHYNLLYREEEREMNRFCADTGVGLIPWAPLAQGRLARDPNEAGRTPRSAAVLAVAGAGGDAFALRGADLAIAERVRAVAAARGWPMSHVALAWLCRRVASPVVGVATAARLDEAMAVRGKVLTEAEEKRLEEPYLPKEVSGHV